MLDNPMRTGSIYGRKNNPALEMKQQHGYCSGMGIDCFAFIHIPVRRKNRLFNPAICRTDKQNRQFTISAKDSLLRMDPLHSLSLSIVAPSQSRIPSGNQDKTLQFTLQISGFGCNIFLLCS